MRLYQEGLTPRELTVAFRRVGGMASRSQMRQLPPTGEPRARPAAAAGDAMPALPSSPPVLPPAEERCPQPPLRACCRLSPPLGSQALPVASPPCPRSSRPVDPRIPLADNSREACAQLFSIGQALLPAMDAQGLATALWCCSRFHYMPPPASDALSHHAVLSIAASWAPCPAADPRRLSHRRCDAGSRDFRSGRHTARCR